MPIPLSSEDWRVIVVTWSWVDTVRFVLVTAVPRPASDARGMAAASVDTASTPGRSAARSAPTTCVCVVTSTRLIYAR